ncbi:MAG: amidohydrolase, partial [Chloroflexota bacterium]|nr:amidohydrolase [Chloroflexota bacterium]
MERYAQVGRHPGVVQVLMPSGSRIPYGQRFFHPICAAACDCGLPVVIHPGSEGTGIAGPPTAGGYPTSYFEWHTALSGSFQAHLLSLVAEGCFRSFPPSGSSSSRAAWCGCRPCCGGWTRTGSPCAWRPLLDRPPSEVVRDHILLTTQPIEEPPDWRQFHQMLDLFDAARMLMFSSDRRGTVRRESRR